tara:strand:- start:359 stop:2284 length:1926 start_codon:yes stop_codon:yes gene_type:complete
MSRDEGFASDQLGSVTPFIRQPVPATAANYPVPAGIGSDLDLLASMAAEQAGVAGNIAAASYDSSQDGKSATIDKQRTEVSSLQEEISSLQKISSLKEKISSLEMQNTFLKSQIDEMARREKLIGKGRARNSAPMPLSGEPGLATAPSFAAGAAPASLQMKDLIRRYINQSVEPFDSYFLSRHRLRTSIALCTDYLCKKENQGSIFEVAQMFDLEHLSYFFKEAKEYYTKGHKKFSDNTLASEAKRSISNDIQKIKSGDKEVVQTVKLFFCVLSMACNYDKLQAITKSSSEAGASAAPSQLRRGVVGPAVPGGASAAAARPSAARASGAPSRSQKGVVAKDKKARRFLNNSLSKMKISVVARLKIIKKLEHALLVDPKDLATDDLISALNELPKNNSELLPKGRSNVDKITDKYKSLDNALQAVCRDLDQDDDGPILKRVRSEWEPVLQKMRERAELSGKIDDFTWAAAVKPINDNIFNLVEMVRGKIKEYQVGLGGSRVARVAGVISSACQRVIDSDVQAPNDDRPQGINPVLDDSALVTPIVSASSQALLDDVRAGDGVGNMSVDKSQSQGSANIAGPVSAAKNDRKRVVPQADEADDAQKRFKQDQGSAAQPQSSTSAKQVDVVTIGDHMFRSFSTAR